MSDFAFGTYRVTENNPLHIQAIRDAVNAGVRLIDTSTNYMDGSAERAIALALQGVSNDIANEVEIVSKFGYIQGTNLLKHKEEPYEDVVEFSESCYHSISPSFMETQLMESLLRLERKSLDCYLLHNPEYFLYDAIKKEIPRDEMLDTMFDKIYDVFVALEKQVEKGTIKTYGISSNSFAKPQSHLEFLPYEDLITLADRAAEYVGNESHSFSTIELPINILEQEGLKCACWAKSNGLRVLANRPLNAQKDDLTYRLADYEESKEYFHNLNELLDICDNDRLRNLYNLVEQLDTNKHKFGWIGDYDSFLYAQVLPHIKKSLEGIEEEYLEILLQYIELFLDEYRKMVLYECSKMTRIALKDEFSECQSTLQECAIAFLRERDSIDYILVGMRKPSYVAQIMALKA
ncbi:MAG: aldo/keto reductase [Campylobacterales bacterium]|nr:aldo/keto reductase [Campylobacterales bacterium]